MSTCIDCGHSPDGEHSPSGHCRICDGPAPCWSLVGPADTPDYRMAFVLYHWPHPTIERATLRALLPKGKQVPMPPDRVARYRAKGDYRVGSTNQVSRAFLGRLNLWEKKFRAIRREGTRVVILDRQFFAQRADLLVIDKAMWLAEIVQEYRHADVVPETRRRELLTLQRLMQAVPGSDASGRGAVRLLPRSKTL